MLAVTSHPMPLARACATPARIDASRLSIAIQPAKSHGVGRLACICCTGCEGQDMICERFRATTGGRTMMACAHATPQVALRRHQSTGCSSAHELRPHGRSLCVSSRLCGVGHSD
jgi:hypothetical protein